MDLHLTATGTPGNAEQDINKQLKAVRDVQPESWPTLAALRDDVAKLTKAYADDETIQVDVDIKIQVKRVDASVSRTITPAGFGLKAGLTPPSMNPESS